MTQLTSKPTKTKAFNIDMPRRGPGYACRADPDRWVRELEQKWFVLVARILFIFLANVRGEVALLAFGIKACFAGDVPKVPKGQ